MVYAGVPPVLDGSFQNQVGALIGRTPTERIANL